MTLRELRRSRGWSQAKLGELARLSPSFVSRLESGELGANPEHIERLAAAFECSVEELPVTPARPRGRQKVEERELLERFRVVPYYDPTHGRAADTYLAGARKSYPNLMQRLDPQLAQQEAWRAHLGRAPADSALEVLVMGLELERGARPVMVSPLKVGFDVFPVVERESPRIVGHCPVPGLARTEWLWIHQVTVRTPWRYRVDGLLLLLEPYRMFYHLEIDGHGHNPRWDRERTRRLGMRRIKLSEKDVLAGVSLTDRLTELGLLK